MKPILDIQQISKKFQIRHENQPYLSLRDSMTSLFRAVSQPVREDFYALKHISFQVEEGDTLGIIGKNGAGKSTLLKILSKITPPTSGRIVSRGRIASLLEVGTGFHPELSGRENIFLNGSIMGMRRKEIQSKFDEIVEFSGVAKFIDTPLKRYSSGMQLRLAFSVVAFLEPEILVFDEVLAVGDAEFQKKCMGKMEDISKSGRTILFVSHNMAAINSLCSRCIYLKNGEIFEEGPANKVVNSYIRNESAVNTEAVYQYPKQPGDSTALLHTVRLIGEGGEALGAVDLNTPVGVEIIYELLGDDSSPYPNIHLFRLSGDYVFVSVHDYNNHLSGKGLHRAVVWIPADLLNDGSYVLGVALTTISSMTVHFFEKNCLTFDVIENINKRNSPYLNVLPGSVRPKLKWESFKLN